VEFRILGPFEVLRDGASLALGSAKQRALLAVLVLHRGELLSADRLIDELWEDRAPASAGKALQGYVSHLRKVLGDGVIVTRGRGYELAVGADQVDVGQFEVLAREGRRALSRNDSVRARERLGAALELWRGEPLGDFAYESFAQNEIARLHEAHRSALEDRIKADLALGRDAELIAEIEGLVAANPLRERLRGQLMIALYRSGRQADALSVYRETRELLSDELGLEPGRGLKELERMVLEQDAALEAAPIASAGVDGDTRVVCPFKGLAHFDRADAEYFCGREEVVSDLIARLAESTLVGILGPSGIGKSSILRAGVLPALTGGVLPGSANWRQVVLRPGEQPCAELRSAVGNGTLRESLARLVPGDRIVVAVDQLEELFTFCRSEDERVEFLQQLVAAAGDTEQRALVVCSCRADFYGRVGCCPRFAEMLNRNHTLLVPMSREELARAIEQPAARAGLEVERALVGALVADVAGEPGGLPLLSTTLLELWRARDGRVLRLERYRSSGGVRGAVARLAESAYTQLAERERGVARSLMLRLASGDDDALARRRVPLAQLEQLEGAEGVLAALIDARLLTISDGEVELSHEAVLWEWPRYRAWLEEDRIGRRLHVHLTTAAAEWDDRDRDPGELYRGARLVGALDWSKQPDNQPNSLEREFIAASERRAQRGARRLRLVLAGVALLLVVSLIAGGIALIEKQHATLEARVALAGELGAQAVSQPRLDVAMLLAREAVSLRPSAQSDGELLTTLLRWPAVIGTYPLAASSAPELALSPDGRTLATAGFVPGVLAVGGDLRFSNSFTHALRHPILNDYYGVEPPVYSTDGSLIVYPAIDHGITVLNVRNARTLALRTRIPLATPFGNTLFSPITDSVSVAPDRHILYETYVGVGNPAPTFLERRALPSGRLLSTTQIASTVLTALRLIDPGDRLVVVAGDAIRLFDARTMRLLRTTVITRTSIASAFGHGGPRAAVVSPDGHTVVIASQTGPVYFVDASTGKVRRGIGGSAAPVASVIYPANGRTVVSVGDDGQAVVWDPKTARATAVVVGPAGQIVDAVINRDGTTLYTSAIGGILLQWDLVGGRQLERRARLAAVPSCCGTLTPDTPPFALSADGSSFAARLGPRTVGVFSAQTLQLEGSFRIPATRGRISALAWSPTTPELAVADYPGAVQLWRLDGAPHVVQSLTGLESLRGLREAVQTVAFSPDGTRVAASDVTVSTSGYGAPVQTLAIWRTTTGRLVAPTRELNLSDLGLHIGAGEETVAFSHSGRLLAVTLLDGEVPIVNASTGRIRRTLRPSSGAATLAFAPDGRLMTGSPTGALQMWNPDTGNQLAPHSANSADPVTSIAFDATGKRFATAGLADGSVKLWSTATFEQMGPTLITHPGATATVAFGARGANLVAVDDRGDGVRLPTATSTWEHRACAIAARNLTRAEWAEFVPGHTYTKLCR
jgi:DNA-binding SARP family transcriptional activator/WD40 repeat protein